MGAGILAIGGEGPAQVPLGEARVPDVIVGLSEAELSVRALGVGGDGAFEVCDGPARVPGLVF